MRNYLYTLAIVCLSACAAGPQFSQLQIPDDDFALLYIIRPSSMGMLDAVEVEIGGVEVAEVRAQGFSLITVSPGHRKVLFPVAIGQVGNEVDFEFEAESGKRYSYVYSMKMGEMIAIPGFAAINIQNGVAQLSEDQPVSLLQGLKES